MDIFLITLSITLLLSGIIGCIVPILPGPSLSFIGLLLFHFTRWGGLSVNILIWLGVVTAIITVIDYVLPIWTTKKFGGTKRGVLGAALGLIVGLFFAPLGIIIGPFLGAFIGEMTANNNSDQAFRSAIGSFVGLLFGTVAKLTVSFVMVYYFVKTLFG